MCPFAATFPWEKAEGRKQQQHLQSIASFVVIIQKWPNNYGVVFEFHFCFPFVQNVGRHTISNKTSEYAYACNRWEGDGEVEREMPILLLSRNRINNSKLDGCNIFFTGKFFARKFICQPKAPPTHIHSLNSLAINLLEYKLYRLVNAYCLRVHICDATKQSKFLIQMPNVCHTLLPLSIHFVRMWAEYCMDRMFQFNVPLHSHTAIQISNTSKLSNIQVNIPIFIEQLDISNENNIRKAFVTNEFIVGHSTNYLPRHSIIYEF